MEGKRMANVESLVKEAMSLRPVQRAKLIDALLSSLSEPNREIDALWAEEAESRIDAYEQGRIKAVSLESVLDKYR